MEPENTSATPTRLAESDRQRVLVEWNATASDYPRDATLPEVFSRVVTRFADKVAVEFGARHLTYRELDARANALAARLRQVGVDTDVRVGLAVERSLDLIVAVVAIVKAGGAYVPLDVAYPRERLVAMMEDARPRVLLTSRALAARLPGEALPRVMVDEVAQALEPVPPSRAWPDSLAYVGFTSGSTGRPKGVGTTHQGVLRNQLGVSYARFGPDETQLLLTPISFDASTLEIWGALLTGGRLVVMPPGVPSLEELARVIREARVTTLWLTAALFSQVVEENLELLRPVKQLLSGGDAVSPAHVRRVVDTLKLPVTNGYGPTEATVFATTFTATHAEQAAQSMPIGRPISNVRAYVLDAHGEPVAPGVVGELYLGGEGLARGYMEQPALTAERFLPDPFHGVPGARMYRTGDLVRWRDDGVLDIVGRADHQVKIRGFRIELAEVEAALRALPSVRDAAVVAQAGAHADKKLVAHVVAAPGRQLDSRALRAALRDRLPEFMVPSVVVVRDALPLTHHNKVDRRALAAQPLPLQEEGGSDASEQAPRGHVEELLTQLVGEVLGIQDVARDAAFHDLGGHSLSATRLISRIRRTFAVDLPLTPDFAARTVAELARDITERTHAPLPRDSEPTRLPDDAPRGVSASQERMWFIHQLQPGLRAYHHSEAVELRGPLDVAALEDSLQLLLRRHAALRTLVVSHEGQPVPRLHPVAERVLQVEESPGTLPWARMREETHRLFDLEHGPLYRFQLFRIAPEHHVLQLVMHHLVMDGMSLDILFRELGLLLAAPADQRRALLPEPALTFSDFVVWQRAPRGASREDVDLEYWARQLAGAPSRLTLPTHRPRPSVVSDRGAVTPRHRLSPALRQSLRAVCQRYQVTPFMVLHAAFAVVLHRYSGQDELCVGTPVSGRTHPAADDLVGLFINTVVLRTRVEERASFVDLLTHVRTTALEAVAHQHAPFERVVEKLLPERAPGESPLFQVMFDMSRMEHPLASAFPAHAPRTLHVSPEASAFDLQLTVYKVEEEYELFFRYRTELFDEASIQRLATHYLQLLDHALQSPEVPLRQHSLHSQAELQQVLRDFNATQRPFDEEATLASLLQSSVARTPDAVALVTPETTLTFSGLHARAALLASHLAALGAGPERVVGLCLERSADSIVALLAIQLSGSACLPLDPSHPVARRTSLLRASSARLLVSRPALFDGASLDLALVQPGDEARPHAPRAPPQPPRPDSLAYVLYTSGSTGEPKGVELTHRNLVHCFASFDAHYDTAPGSTWAASSSVSFDMHLEELLYSLSRGARVVLRPVGPLHLGRDILQHGITHIVITPSSLAAAFEEPGAPEALRRLRVVVTGGEALTDALVRQLAFTNTRIVNAYGPTETSVCVAIEHCDAQHAVSLGKPLDRSRLYVLDEALQPQPVGVPGELFVGGEGVGRGYRARADLTAERFIPDAFSEVPGARLYRTGDRVRWNEDGTLSFLGRTDFQLKVRGVRVELEEVEAALLRLDGIRQAAVIARQSARDLELVAFFVSENPSPDLRALRRALARVLPEAMVPSRLCLLDALPMNTSGKVDRKALAAIPVEAAADTSAPAEPPRGPAEELLALLFRQVLQVEQVHRGSDFFSLGGHSLSATRLVARIRQSFGVELPLATVFSTPTLEALARVLSSPSLEQAEPLPAPTPRRADEPLLPAPAQERLWFIHQLQPSLRAYHIPEALELKGPLDVEALEASLRLLLERHASLRGIFVSDDGRPVPHLRPLPAQVLQREDLTATEEDTSTRVLAQQGSLDVEGMASSTRLQLEGHASRRGGFAPDDGRPTPQREDLTATEGDILARLQVRLHEESRRAFSLAEGPLYRFRLFRLGAEHHVLLLVLHHILVDGVSVEILLRELAQAYAALRQHREPALPAVTLTQADAAVWLRSPAVRAQEDLHLDYWKQQLAGAPTSLSLPLDKPRPAVRGDEGAFARPHTLSPVMTRALAELCREHHVTPFMALYAAFAALLHRYSAQDELCVGVPVSGRAHPAVDDVVGLFINTVVLRTRVSASTSFAGLLSQVRATALDAFSHQAAPFERVVEALQVERTLHQTPLFQVLFDLNRMNRAWDGQVAEGLTPRHLFVDNGTSQFDLSLSVSETASGFELYLQYDTQLFTASSAERMLSHYVRLLEHALETPALPVGALSLLGAEEHQQMVRGFSAAPWTLDGEATLASLLLASAGRTPDAIALVAPEGAFTFARLFAQASRLAAHLTALGAGPERVVGLCLERSADCVVSLLAIHLSGSTCLPLEPAHPSARRASLLRKSDARLLVSRPSMFDGAPLDIPLVQPEDAARSDAPLAPPVPARLDHLAYVLYTSGSTGEPKGVELTQRNLFHCFAALDALYDTSPGATWAASSSLSFDIHFEELLYSLTRGARVVMRPVGPLNLGRDILQHGITHVSLTPSGLAAAFEEPGAPEALRRLRVLISGGEVLPDALVRQLAFTDTRLINTYGPIETTLCVTADASERPVSLGSPLGHCQLYVLDGSLQPVPIGVPGEVFIAGPNLARAYRASPHLTAERFLPNPFSSTPGARLYRTGDLARWLPDGTLGFIGRSDLQLKVRGVRVELAEVEAALRLLPGVRQCAVIPRLAPPHTELVAFVVPDALPVDLAALRTALARHLPAAMLPSHFGLIEALPLSSSGKVDRNALSALPLPSSPASSFSPPVGHTEELLALLFSQVLGLDSLSRDADFFSLGGHSLAATRLVSRIRHAFNVDLSLSSFFSAPSIASLAQLIESQRFAQLPALSSPSRQPPDAPLQPTFAQERLWFLHQWLPGLRAYVIPEAIEFRGPLNVTALDAALRLLLQRHDTLRMHFASEEDHLTLQLSAVPSQVLHLEEVTSPPGATPAIPWARLREESRRLLPLTQGPLYHFRLFRLGAEHHVLLLVLHHILVDGLSLDLLLRELAQACAALHEGRAPDFAPIALSQTDVAAWQRLPTVRVHEEAHLDYWKQQLAGAPTLLSLPLDKPRPPVLGDAGALSTVRRLSLSRTQALTRLCRQHQVTPFMVLHAAFAALLHRYSGQDELCVGVPVSGRTHPAMDDVVGLFINTVALRSHFTPGLTFTDLLSQVRTTALEAFSHQAAPFERVVQALQVERGTDHMPLVQVMFDMGRELASPLEGAFPDLTAHKLLVDNKTSPFDLTLGATEVADGLEFAITYSTGLFEPATIERLLTHYLQLLEGALQAPGTAVARLPLLTGDEVHEALRQGRIAPASPPETCVHEDFVAQALRVPDRVALAFEGGQWTYRALEDWTRRAAHRLASQGVGQDQLVAAFGSRDESFVRAVLAIHRAGGAHMPLDARLPPARVAQLLAESQPPFVLATSHAEPRLAEVLSLVPAQLRPQVLTLDALAPVDLGALEHRTSPEALAYVVFTSGSTGVPKGVMVHHRGLRNHILGMVDGLRLREGDIIAQTAALSFDISVWQMLGALTLGATTLLISDESVRDPQRLATELALHGATVVGLVPSMIHALLEDSVASAIELPRLRCMITGGESMPPAVCRAWFERHPGVPLVPSYGAAECSDASTLHWMEAAPEGSTISIGVPKRAMEVHVLDEALQPVPPGVVGEFYLGGVGVGRGYRHRPDLTADRFIPHPFAETPGERLYRTGDLGRRRVDGCLEFLTRADFQVKVRGVRIELAEVEAALSSLPSVRACAVTVREARPGEKELVAWVVTPGHESPAALREALSQKLPSAMLPSRFVALATLPLNPNGKVDRRALSLQPVPAQEELAGEPPRGPTEEHVARLFREVLGVEQVWRDSDFFALGGHSLSATRVVSRVRKELGVQLPLSMLFTQPTVAGLAQAIDKAPRLQVEPTSAPRATTGPQLASRVQERLWYALQLPDAPPYVLNLAFVLEGPLQEAALEAALAATLERNQTLRTVFVHEHGTLHVHVRPTSGSVLERVDLSHLSPEAALAETHAAVSRQDQQPFDVARGPLYRFELLRLDSSGTRHALLLAVSHLVCDGLGLRVFLEEVAAAYRAALDGETRLLAPAPLQYADLVPAQRGEQADRQEAASLESWKQALANAPPVLDLPVDFPRRAPALNAHMRTTRVALNASLGAALQEVARRERVSTFTAVLALVQSWLHRLSGQGHVVVASPFSGRTLPETERMVGYFANVLPLCTDVTGNPSFQALLRRVQGVVSHATAHQEVTFKSISDAVSREGPRTAPALAQALVMLDSSSAFRMEQLSVSELDTEGVIPAYDVVVSLIQDAHGALGGILAFDSALFTAESRERMARSFEQWVHACLRTPDVPLSRLSMLSDRQRAEVLAALDGGPQEIPTGACIHTLFEAQVRRTPDAPAVAHGSTTWSYAELNARANLLARQLVKQGLLPEERVGVVMQPSTQAMAVLLGILKAGGTYVPLDADWPEARKRAVLERTDIHRLWVDEDVWEDHAWLVPHVAVPTCPESPPRDVGPGPRGVSDAQVAYIVFTSGSTGEPKGVMVEHRSVVNHNLAIVKRFGLRAGDRMLQFAPLTFDAAAEDLYPPLVVGATVVLRNGLVPAHAMTPYLEETDITLISLPPTYIEEWIRQMESSGQRLPRRLRLLAPGGDVLKRETYDAWVRVGGEHAPWVNVYGPTECTITSATCDIPGAEGLGTSDTFPIGRPIPGVRIYLLDDDLAPVLPGQPGGVYIGGAALSRGYLGAPHATAERFIPDPFHEAPGARMYRTGDLARLLPDGRLRFLGRADHQVKIRGFRIELAEIETCLRRFAGVEEAVVLALTTAAGVQSLRAYVQAPATVKAEALREQLAAQLPSYMVPASFVVLERLPINANGKVDRQALRDVQEPPPQAPQEEARSAPPSQRPFRSSLEMVLHRLWKEVLEQPDVDVGDDFFTSGGDSILAMRLLARLEEEFGLPLPLAVLFQNPVLRDSADAILDYLREESVRSCVVRLASRNTPPTAAPLFLFHGGDGEVHHYRELVPLLEPRFSCHGIQAPETLTPDRPLASFEERVATYARDIRAVQPHGPYRLVGFSYGGYPALGVAAHLEAQGEQVELLALVDTLTSELIGGSMPSLTQGPVLGLAAELGVLDESVPALLEGLSPEAQWEWLAEQGRARGQLSAHMRAADLQRMWKVLGEVLTPQAAKWNITAPGHVRPLIIRSTTTLTEFHDEALGWTRYMPRAQLDLESLTGQHADLLRAPRVEELARLLLQRVE
ncbi:amino acid adenylation domain-containing protein [Myxococcus stipitatus]|uniref:non-ribosomal peptide synthetase n=1 Tax=Myxococcus stipitatus TaxID=83455 RepID=UPI00314568BF